MNSSDITNYISSDRPTYKLFRGVMPYDLLPDKILTGFYIVNTDKSTGPGKHWVCVFIDDNVTEYFDSYGKPPIEVMEFIKRTNRPVIYSSKCIQSPHSDVCGDYCIMYAYFKSNGKNLKWYLDLFSSTDTNYNDKLIQL